jgi:hypothetical protein
VVAASGFIFVFSPGLPMGLLARRSPAFDRGLIFWGMGVWLVALLPSLFLQSVLRQIVANESPPRAASALTFVGAFVTALFVQGAMYAVLRRTRKRALPQGLLANSLALGFGVGLIAQLFTGLSLVGAGFRLMLGDTSTPTLAELARVGHVELGLGLLPLLLFRPALLVVCAARGVLVARALLERPLYFWLAVLVDSAFVWVILAIQLALGGEEPGQLRVGAVDPAISVVSAVYYLLAFGLAYRWLLTQMSAWIQTVREAK